MNEIYDQIIGATYKFKEYNETDYNFHYETLKEADEYCSAASLYPDERTDLLANSLHKYQNLIDKATEILNLETDFLMKKKICFNFYTDIANLFGLGTQAYTTETETPYIGVSELSLQEIYLLQLILLHEMQHAMDFVYFSGFKMGIAERELRARITICHSLNELQKQFNKLYKNAYVDQAYWFVILYNSPHVDERTKHQYFELLEKKAKDILSDEDGVVFSPLILRVFGRELIREGVDLRANLSYKIQERGGLLIMETAQPKIALEEEEYTEMEEQITQDTETYNDEEPLSVKLSRLTGENMGVVPDGSFLLVKNKMLEWHTYKDEFKSIKKQASVVITRNAESFSNIAVPEDSAISSNSRIQKVEKKGVKVDNTIRELREIEIPGTDINLEFKKDLILPKSYKAPITASNDDYDDNIAQNMVNNLSQLIKKRD
ncbi:MAG: hypothetical protein U0457_07115 [Candidatus Sericytochromatia bacterium]